MNRYIKIYIVNVKNSFMLFLSHRFEFVMGGVANITWTIGQVITIRYMFTKIDSFDGWSFGDLILLLGFGQILVYVSFIFFEVNFRYMSDKIISGEFDRYLLKPLNIKFQVSLERISISEIIPSITAVIPLIVYSFYINDNFDTVKVLLALVIIFTSLTLFYFLFLILGALNFFFDNAQQFKTIFFFGAMDLNRVPISVLPKFIQAYLTFIAPVAFTTFYPVLLIKDEISFMRVFIPEVILLVVLIILSNYAWKLGLKKYSGAA